MSRYYDDVLFTAWRIPLLLFWVVVGAEHEGLMGSPGDRLGGKELR